MLIVGIAFLALALASSPDHKRRHDEVDDHIRGAVHDLLTTPGFTTGRLFSIEEVAMRYSRAISSGKLLAGVIEAGEFRDEQSAVTSLVGYNSTLWQSLPELDFIAQSIGRGHPGVARLLVDYTRKNERLCMFSALPPSLQRRYSDIFVPDPDMTLEFQIDASGKRKLIFPRVSKAKTYHVVMHDDRYGELQLDGPDSWSFDLHKQCIIKNAEIKLQLLAHVRSAIEIDKFGVHIHMPRRDFHLDATPRRLQGFASPTGEAFYIVAEGDVYVCELVPGACGQVAADVTVSEVDGDYLMIDEDIIRVPLLGEASRPGGLKYHYNAIGKRVLPTGEVLDDKWGYIHSEFYWECFSHQERLNQTSRTASIVAVLQDACAAVQESREIGPLSFPLPEVSDEFKRAVEEIFSQVSFSPDTLSDIFYSALYGFHRRTVSIAELASF